MTYWIFVLTMISGGCGAVMRFLAHRVVTARITTALPVATFLINATGSLVLGWLTGLSYAHPLDDAAWMTILSTGLLGGYTTFSTVSVETARLVLARAYFAALATSFLALMICVGAAAAGFVLGQR